MQNINCDDQQSAPYQLANGHMFNWFYYQVLLVTAFNAFNRSSWFTFNPALLNQPASIKLAFDRLTRIFSYSCHDRTANAGPYRVEIISRLPHPMSPIANELVTKSGHYFLVSGFGQMVTSQTAPKPQSFRSSACMQFTSVQTGLSWCCVSQT